MLENENNKATENSYPSLSLKCKYTEKITTKKKNK